MYKRKRKPRVQEDYEKSRVAVLLRRMIEFLTILMPLISQVGKHLGWW